MAGKSTLIEEIMKSESHKLYEKIGTITSTTTREPRGTKEDSLSYHFITREDFEQKKELGDFVEFDKVGEHLYGYEKNIIAAVLEERNIICAATEHGVLSLKKAYEKTGWCVVVPIKIISRYNKELREAFYRKHPGREQADRERSKIKIAYKKEIINSFKKGGLEKATEKLARFIKSVIGR